MISFILTSKVVQNTCISVTYPGLYTFRMRLLSIPTKTKQILSVQPIKSMFIQTYLFLNTVTVSFSNFRCRNQYLPSLHAQPTDTKWKQISRVHKFWYEFISYPYFPNESKVIFQILF